MNPHVFNRDESPSEKAEREKLANTPGLTKEQQRGIRDPELPLRNARLLLDILRKQAAVAHAAKPEAVREMDRAMGQATIENDLTVRNLRGGVVQQFGGTVEVPRG